MSWNSKDLDNEAQILGLGPRRQGDISPFHDWNANWGQVATLHPGESKTLITTQMFPINMPIAYQLRWALRPTGPFTPALPAPIDGVRVQLLKSIDLRTGQADEEFTLFGGQAQPSCVLICRKLSILMTSLVGEGGANVSIQAAVCPVQNIDCNELRGRGDGYALITQQHFTQTQLATPIVVLAPNSRRAQFFVQNQSTNSDVIVQMGTDAAFGPPPVGVMILPAGINGIYESPIGGWTGPVSISFSNGTGDGGALITEGTF